MKKHTILILIIIFLTGVSYLTLRKSKIFKVNSKVKIAQHDPNIGLINESEKKVIITVKPKMNFSYDFMKSGVIQHLDRNYTYDYIPKELENGLLYQGIHRPANGTSVKIELIEPATIYFFFHSTIDGGYTEIFENLKGWERSNDAPKYDIYNGYHGLKMKMYKLNAEKGIYQIPATTKERACFNIAFKFK